MQATGEVLAKVPLSTQEEVRAAAAAQQLGAPSCVLPRLTAPPRRPAAIPPPQMNEAADSCAEAAKAWRDVPVQQRARVMMKLQGLIRDNMDNLARAVTMEQGKTLPDAAGDVFRGLGALPACQMGAPRVPCLSSPPTHATSAPSMVV